MRIGEIISEAYLGTPVVETDYGDKVPVEVFSNPSRRDIFRMFGESEYASVRASLYPETDALIV